MEDEYQQQTFWGYYKAQIEFIKSLGLIATPELNLFSNGLYTVKIAIINNTVIISEITKNKK